MVEKENRYMFCLDMDGTLLNSKSKIPLQTVKYLQKLEKEGHIVVLASGRPLRALKSYYAQINLHTPIVCYNGAYCYHPYDNTFEETHYIFSKEIIKQIYIDSKEAVLNVMCETNDKIWLIKPNQDLATFFWHDGMRVVYGDILETLTEDPWTMIMHDKGPEYDKIIIDAVKKHPGFDVRFWYNSSYSEIYYTKTSKAKCLEEIAKYYDIPHSHMVCIGDANNDIEMIEKAGIGIAMKNGSKLLLEKAEYISEKDNDHQGVMVEIKKILEGKLK